MPNVSATVIPEAQELTAADGQKASFAVADLIQLIIIFVERLQEKCYFLRFLGRF